MFPFFVRILDGFFTFFLYLVCVRGIPLHILCFSDKAYQIAEAKPVEKRNPRKGFFGLFGFFVYFMRKKW